MKILIASVYNEKSLMWHDIQSDFLKKTTLTNYDHLIFFFGKSKNKNFIIFFFVGSTRKTIYGI